MEAEFIALAAAGKEAEWLRNLIYEIPLWPKLISPISIHYDSAATLAKAYCQIYNGKSRHLGLRHNMVQELRGFCSISTKLGGSLNERICPRLSAQVGYRVHRNL
ncbi:hypothetical protein Tco_0082806 [Tanacetum coccineum]